jgi:hypothetical protein
VYNAALGATQAVSQMKSTILRFFKLLIAFLLLSVAIYIGYYVHVRGVENVTDGGIGIGLASFAVSLTILWMEIFTNRK